MTKEAIDYNVNRLNFFTNTKLHKEVRTGLELIEYFTHLSDLVGGGRDQYTLLLLTKNDFEEFSKLVSEYPAYQYTESRSFDVPGLGKVGNLSYVSFHTDCYMFHVMEIVEYEFIAQQTIKNPRL